MFRTTIRDYIDAELGDGKNLATLRVEVSGLRQLFKFMLDMEAYVVMLDATAGEG